MLVYLTEEEVRRLESGKFVFECPDQLPDWFKIYDPEPLRELNPAEIDQAKTELNCSDEELAGMELPISRDLRNGILTLIRPLK